MSFIEKLLAVLLSLTSLFAYGGEQENPASKLNWQIGPIIKTIDDMATLEIPENYYFLDRAETNKYLELNQNPATGKESLFTDGASWEAYLNFENIGYVEDNETIDADDLLVEYKKGVKVGNDYRREKGWATLEVQGWFFKPHYDKGRNLLEWAFLLKDSRTQKNTVNYYTKVLGRSGAVSVLLVADPEVMDDAILDLKYRLKDFSFIKGERYSEFKEGDKVAEYGLAALILGGAAAVASKKGFFGVILAFLAGAWKILLIPFVFAIGWIKSLFTKNK